MNKPWLLPGACSCLQSRMNFEMSGNKTINIAELAINSCPMDLAQIGNDVQHIWLVCESIWQSVDQCLTINIHYKLKFISIS